MHILQLTKELVSGNTFVGWKEGLINFPPTYKYERNTTRYVGELHNEEEKKRSPAWLSLFDYTVFLVKIRNISGMHISTYTKLKHADHDHVSKLEISSSILESLFCHVFELENFLSEF